MSIASAIVFLLVSSCVPASGVPASCQEKYDGGTWRAWPHLEREEFINGYIGYLLTQGQTFEGRLASYERELSAHLDSTPDAKSADVADLLSLIAPRVRPVRARGETYDNKYGIFLGHYWILHQDKERVRFLQGYSHANRRNPKATERYSKTAEAYERLVDQEFDKKDSDLNRGIGEVLSLFRDQSNIHEIARSNR